MGRKSRKQDPSTRKCLISSRDSKEGRVAGYSGWREGGGEVRDVGGDQSVSGLVGYKKDFASTLSQRQPLESSEQRSNLGPLMFFQNSICPVESRLQRGGGQ